MFSIDATEDSSEFGFGRMINHSKKRKNCFPKLVVDFSEQPHICFFAHREVHVDEELLFDYGDRSSASLFECPWLKY